MATSAGSALSGDSAGPVGPPVDRREPQRAESLLTAGALALVTVIGVVVLAALGVASTPDVGTVVLSFAAVGIPTGAVVVRLVLVVATAVVAGLGLVRPLTALAVPPRTLLWLGASSGLVAAASVVLAGVLGDAGWPAVAVHAALVVLVAATLPTTTVLRHVTTVAAVLLTGVVAVEVGIVRWGVAAVAELVATVVLTVAVALAVGAASASSDGAARRRTVAGGLVASTVAAVLAAGQLVVDGPWTVIDVLHTLRGPIALAQVALPVLAALLLLPSLRAAAAAGRGDDLDDRLAGRRRELCRWAAGALGLTLAAVAVLGAVPAAPQAPESGRAVVRPVSLGAEPKALFVASTPGGPTLVRLSDVAGPVGADPGPGTPAGGHRHGAALAAPAPGTYTVSAGAATAPFLVRPGSPGRWAMVDVPAGADRLTVTGPQGAATVPITTGPTTVDGATLAGPDGPECLDAQLGDLLGGGTGDVACPSTSLTPVDAHALASTLTELRTRGLPSVHLVGDDSPRSRAAVALLRSTAARIGLPVNDVPRPEDGLVVLSGWSSATATLTDATAAATRTPTFAGGQFLAPWLLVPGVLSAGSSTMFPVEFTPQDATPRGYAALLTTISSDAAPSTAGYRAWAHARGITDGVPRLYAAAGIDAMPGMAMDHGDRAGAWFPGGGIVPVSGVLP